ncbi:TIM barrel protein [Actinoplanes derwentensis]|uniref:Hydroxypyruvate isomerase n=1 Tax=Actinoplanes derwentensis TaxID=113562 RepID=A0A1H1V851_9ACTN|nr:TIM barrel protein [Actinoplanes derwentensis]GID89257.1 hydroxypyruvate isomerase [Actinoplanes derwentensis]SDS80810.1 hydroxypyruvate isomerase [Actinoplanes derwentensis]
MSFTLAICSEMVYLDLPHLDRVRRIHDAGFAVEIWGWTDKDAAVLAATGARFTSMTGYVTGDLVTKEGADDLLRTAADSIAFAQRIGRPGLNLHGTGLGEGGLPVRPHPVVTGADWIAAARTLERIAALGEQHGVTFVVENLNLDVDHPGVPFARAADTLTLVAAVGSPHLRMNLDLYHAQIGEGNLAELIRRSAPYLGEVQIADVPGRCEPLTGEVRWDFLARVLADSGYDGTVALEAWASQPGVKGSDLALERFRAAFTL